MEQVYTPKQNYKVLVNCMTYNQSKYIEDALEGFAMQKTNFPFVCLVMDDASTDGEQEVIKAWMERECDMMKAEYFEIEFSNIVIVPHKANLSCSFAFYMLKQNLYSTGKKGPLIQPWLDHSDYEALCEGDDYWTNPDKMRRQVEILDNNRYLSSCYSGFDSYINGELNKVNVLPRKKAGEYSIMTIEQWVNCWFTKTLTSMIRISALYEYNVMVKKYHFVRDVHLAFYLLKWGPSAYIHESMGVYNIQTGGVYSTLTSSQKAIENYNCYKELYDAEHHEVLKAKLLHSICLRAAFPRKEDSRFRLFYEAIQLCSSLSAYRSVLLCYVRLILNSLFKFGRKRV